MKLQITNDSFFIIIIELLTIFLLIKGIIYNKLFSVFLSGILFAVFLISIGIKCDSMSLFNNKYIIDTKINFNREQKTKITNWKERII